MINAKANKAIYLMRTSALTGRSTTVQKHDQELRGLDGDLPGTAGLGSAPTGGELRTSES